MVNILSQQLAEGRWVVIEAVDHEELGRAFPAWLRESTASTMGGSPLDALWPGCYGLTFTSDIVY